MSPRRLTAVALAGSVLLAACGAEVAVTSERSTRTETLPAVTEVEPPFSTDLPVTSPAQPPTSDPNDQTTDPPSTDPTTSTTSAPVVDVDAIDFGPNKPDQPYDSFLLASLTDLNAWWTDTYPAVYGEPFQPLEGKVYAAYPSRPNDLPGCGGPQTSYEDVQEFVAFYCEIGDFIVYDDGDRGLLATLADEFGAGTIGIVLAHEYGHAIQKRSGVFDRNLATVVSEQQADCFAGAWAGRAARGEGGVKFSDADVRAGLIAMLEVSDPIGIDPVSPGGHGAGFDRVGSFQLGFQEGPIRCGDLIDNPLPLVPNQFNDLADSNNQGDAPFGYGSEELLGFLVPDLNLHWGIDAAVTGFADIELVPVQSQQDVECDELSSGLGVGAAYCASTRTVFLNEPVALDLYRTFGDFAVGYLIGVAWAEAVQVDLGSAQVGEARQLVNDCLTGAWVQTVIPVNFALPQPRNEARTSVVSPGDLDEAIRTAILIGDVGADDDVLGSSFEKIDAFRSGVLGGIDACAL